MHFKRSLASQFGIGGVKGDFVVESWTKTVTGGKFSNVYGSRAVHKF